MHAQPCTTALFMKELCNSSMCSICPPVTFIPEETKAGGGRERSLHGVCISDVIQFDFGMLCHHCSKKKKKESKECVRWRRRVELSATEQTRAARWWCNSSQLPMVLCWKDEWSRTWGGRQWRHAHTHTHTLIPISSVFWSCGVIHTERCPQKKGRHDALTELCVCVCVCVYVCTCVTHQRIQKASFLFYTSIGLWA